VRAEALVARAIGDQLERARGEADADAAVQAAKDQADKDAILAATALRKKEDEDMHVVVEDEILRWIPSVIADMDDSLQGRPHFFFHPIRGAHELMNQFAEVARDRAELSLFPIPHRVAEAIFEGVVTYDDPRIQTHYAMVDGEIKEQASKVVNGTANVPQLEREMLDYVARRQSVTLRFLVRIYSYGFGGRLEGGYETAQSLVPYEQFCAFRATHPALFSMGELLPQVRVYRSRNTQFRIPSLLLDTNSEITDNLFAALHLLQGAGITQGMCLMGQLMEKELTRFVVAHGGEPLAEGTYACPYNCAFKDLFPTQWADTVAEAVAKKQNAGQAARAFLGRTMSEAAEVYARGATGLKELGARLLPVSIVGVVPDTSGANTPEAVAAAAVKRLAIKLPKRPLCFEQMLQGAAQGLKDYIREKLIRADFTEDGAMAACQRRAEEQFSDAASREEYMAGATEARNDAQVLAGAEPTSSQALAVKKKILAMMMGFKAFIKAELYPTTQEKAIRFIVSPAIRVRAYLNYTFGMTCEAYTKAVRGLTVKGLSEGEQRELLAAKPGHPGVVAVEQDASSFESQVTGDVRHNAERDVLGFVRFGDGAHAKPEARHFFAVFDGLEAEGWTVSSALMTLVLPSIRRSGELLTSIGNMITSICLTGGCAALLGSRGHQEPAVAMEVEGAGMEQVREAARAGTYSMLRDGLGVFEGDDVVLELPDGIAAGMAAMYLKLGLMMKTKITASIAASEFCRKHLVMCRNGIANLPDVRSVLAKMMYWVQPDTMTNHRDALLQYSMAQSYAILYAHVPVVGAFARHVINVLGDKAKETLAILRDTSRRDLLAAEIRRVWQQHFRDYDSNGIELSYMVDLSVRRSMDFELEEVRARCWNRQSRMASGSLRMSSTDGTRWCGCRRTA